MKFGYVGPQLMGDETHIWKCEGATDMLSVLTLIMDADEAGLIPEGEKHTAVCNACGSQERPSKESQWFIERLGRAKEVFVIHDCDKPGQDGSLGHPEKGKPGWATAVAQFTAVVRNVVLPYPIEENHGKDVRDWILERLEAGKDYADIYIELLAYARDDKNSPVITLAKTVIKTLEAELPENGSVEDDSPIEEADNDPHRLARVNLRHYSDEHGGKLRFWREEWWRYRDGQYRRIGNEELKAKVGATIKAEFDRVYRQRTAAGEEVKEVRHVTQALINNVVAAMKAETVLSSSIEMPAWLPDRKERHYLTVENGILDLDALMISRSLEEIVLPHTPEWFCSTKLKYAFDPFAKCEKFIDYLEYSMEGDHERICLLQEWTGYLLTNRNPFQKFMVFEGDGSNGKTVFFAAVTAMLGADNVSNVSLEQFGERFALGSTIGKSLNISADVGQVESVAEGLLKQFSGGDSMLIDRKGIAPITIRPTAKLMMSWNNRPRLKDKSSGLWRRMMVVPFLKTIEESRKIYGMDSPDFWLPEASGILNWAIIGLDRLNKNKRFTVPEICQAANEEYRKESNPVAIFIDESVEEKLYDYEKSSDIYDRYRRWCNENGHSHPLAVNSFFKELKKRIPAAEKSRIGSGSRDWCYKHVKLIE
jgi:P4 family phage/plasmid primase-like protien